MVLGTHEAAAEDGGVAPERGGALATPWTRGEVDVLAAMREHEDEEEQKRLGGNADTRGSARSSRAEDEQHRRKRMALWRGALARSMSSQSAGRRRGGRAGRVARWASMHGSSSEKMREENRVAAVERSRG
jgi:hypothetical protein